jgi:hypothetical protein
VADVVNPNDLWLLVVQEIPGKHPFANRFKRLYDAKYDTASDKLDEIIDAIEMNN